MTGDDILEALLQGSPAEEGPMTLKDLMTYALSHNAAGVGYAAEKDQKWYILFLEGEPDGAVLSDKKGDLFGNKAVYLLKGTEKFQFFPANPEVVDRIILGCRIFDKKILKNKLSGEIPELVRKTEGGVGVLSMQVIKQGVPQQGLRITIRKSGQIIGSDISGSDGKVSFRLLYGTYECVVPPRDFTTEDNLVYEFEFHSGLHNQTVTLNLS